VEGRNIYKGFDGKTVQLVADGKKILKLILKK